MYISPKSVIPFRDLCDLVKCSGGNVINSSKKAGLIVGQWKENENVPCVSGKWILDCIEHGNVLPFDHYLMYEPKDQLHN